ncbi:hypothetical protein K438DRAFT_2029839 [Mycena galopus ATCC 62051]|nr:hypothetical protein K438DRAFT_2029839 [Mycena galopus ATCC 62051]
MKQSANLTAKDLLQNLGKHKAALVERYKRYTGTRAANAEAVPAFEGKLRQESPCSLHPSSLLFIFDIPTATRFCPSHILSLFQLSSLVCPKYTTKAATLHAQRSQALHTAQKATADELEQWRAQPEEAAAKDAAVGYTRPAPGAEYGGRSSEYRSSASAYGYVVWSLDGARMGLEVRGGTCALVMPCLSVTDTEGIRAQARGSCHNQQLRMKRAKAVDSGKGR